MPKSAHISGFDVAARNYKALVNEVVDLGGGDDNMNRLHTDRNLRRRIAELLVGEPSVEVFPLFIDYDQPLAAKIAAGKYDSVHEHISAENFPVGSGEESVEAVIVRLGHIASEKEICAEIERQGLRPATMVELLAFGTRYPEIQREFPIAAFGTVWVDPEVGWRVVGYLEGTPVERELNLYPLGREWRNYDLFLAVRK